MVTVGVAPPGLNSCARIGDSARGNLMCAYRPGCDAHQWHVCLWHVLPCARTARVRSLAPDSISAAIARCNASSPTFLVLGASFVSMPADLCSTTRQNSSVMRWPRLIL